MPEPLWRRYATAPLGALAPGAWTVLDGPGGALDLDVTADRLPDGATLFVGAPATRRAILERFRGLFALILLPVVALGIGGGVVVARRVLAPLRDLAATVARVASTGRLGERVPQRGSGDELDALAGLANGCWRASRPWWPACAARWTTPRTTSARRLRASAAAPSARSPPPPDAHAGALEYTPAGGGSRFELRLPVLVAPQPVRDVIRRAGTGGRDARWLSDPRPAPC